MAQRAESANTDELFPRSEPAPTLVGEGAEAGSQAIPFRLRAFGASAAVDSTPGDDSIRGGQIDLKIELGRTQLAVEDVLKLGTGSVVALDQLTTDPVDIFAEGRLIGRGQVVVLDNKFCVRVTELIAAEQAG